MICGHCQTHEAGHEKHEGLSAFWETRAGRRRDAIWALDIVQRIDRKIRQRKRAKKKWRTPLERQRWLAAVLAPELAQARYLGARATARRVAASILLGLSRGTGIRVAEFAHLDDVVESVRKSEARVKGAGE